MKTALGDIPRIGASNYATSTYNLTAAMGGDHQGVWSSKFDNAAAAIQRFAAAPPVFTHVISDQETTGATVAEKPKTRFVRVLIVDPDENLPLENRLIYSGSEKLTDATDQELFFELDIKALLEKHNERRVKIINKSVKERTEYLEPAKVRDLRMNVTTIAAF